MSQPIKKTQHYKFMLIIAAKGIKSNATEVHLWVQDYSGKLWPA
jgi:hypothetical protein